MKILTLISRAFIFASAMSICLSSAAQEFIWAPQLPVGSSLPPIDAPDQNGKSHSIDELLGENGMVLLISRSYEWCPYCIRQLGQLIEAHPKFSDLGLNVATLTYDPVSILSESAMDHGATFPMLSDAPNYEHVKAMGILNTQYSPGERPYGIGYPGIFLLDAEGKVVAKFAEEDYRERPEFELVLEAARKL